MAGADLNGMTTYQAEKNFQWRLATYESKHHLNNRTPGEVTRISVPWVIARALFPR